jgi:DNA-binding response OmpR family regulator
MANKGNILLLDDDVFLSGIYKEKFTEAGCTIQTVDSVSEALRIVRGGFAPDVILFDITVKEENGFAFIQALRDEHLAQGAYLVALTNHQEEASRQHATELGVDDYIVKAEMIPTEVVQMILSAIRHK